MANLNPKLLEVLACPICKAKLQYDKAAQELICRFDKLAYPIKDGVPVMLVTAARKISTSSD
ncbi:MAG: Trm112 family protein [Gammaproteobacteria bacterium]|nr:Trm112 family protein [Gammaproteobacteria bacterium]